VSSSGRSRQSSGTESTNRSQSSRRSARIFSSSDDADSDDDFTDKEDEFEVDFNDNFWERRQQEQRLVDTLDPDDEESNAEDDIVAPEVAEQNDYASLLASCREFPFIELQPEEASRMNLAQKIYDGPTGL
jgi:hypothetical protein